MCRDDCSSTTCMCGQLSLRCWYDEVRPAATRQKERRQCGFCSSSSQTGFEYSAEVCPQFIQVAFPLWTGGTSPSRVLPRGATAHLRVQSCMLVLEDLQESCCSEWPEVYSGRRVWPCFQIAPSPCNLSPATVAPMRCKTYPKGS